MILMKTFSINYNSFIFKNDFSSQQSAILIIYNFHIFEKYDNKRFIVFLVACLFLII